VSLKYQPVQSRHGETTNQKRTPEYRSWAESIYRCYNPNNQAYKNYGARGITVDDRWLHSFENFLADMGRKPGPEYSLDRKDVDGPYSPENCKWSTTKEQNRNRRVHTMLNYEGLRYCLVEWAEITGINEETISSRLRAGWPIEDALTIPAQVQHHRVPK
jgi:hypothetical protein